jgi:hypothetical protein
MELEKRKCKPCEGGIPRFNSTDIAAYNQMLEYPWTVTDEIKISKEFKFTSYPDMIVDPY